MGVAKPAGQRVRRVPDRFGRRQRRGSLPWWQAASLFGVTKPSLTDIVAVLEATSARTRSPEAGPWGVRSFLRVRRRARTRPWPSGSLRSGRLTELGEREEFCSMPGTVFPV